jgi:hypothetical protein
MSVASRTIGRPAPQWRLTSCLAVAWLCSGCAHSDVTAYSMPGDYRIKELHVRAAAEPGVLLLRRKGEAALRYSLGLRKLTAAAEHEWKSAASPISDCSALDFAPSLVIDRRAATARLGSELLVVRGAPGGQSLSPSRRLVALWTAGSYRESPIPFAGGDFAPPFHLHILTMPDGREWQPPVSLPFDDRDTLRACWLASEDYVVVADAFLLTVAFVPVRPREKQE